MDERFPTSLNQETLEASKGTCIKGLISPPLELKSESCFSPISFDCFIRRITQVLNYGIYLNFNGCYGNKNG